MIEISIDKHSYNLEIPNYKITKFSKIKPILNNNSTENNLNPGFQRTPDTARNKSM